MPRVETPREKAELQANALTGATAKKKTPHDKFTIGPNQPIVKLCGIILQAAASVRGQWSDRAILWAKGVMNLAKSQSMKRAKQKIFLCPEDHWGDPQQQSLGCCLGC